MADETENNNNSEKDNVNYVRKKNIIPGWDNDHLIFWGLVGIGGLIAAPYAKQALDNILTSIRQPQGQQPLPPNGTAQHVTYVQPPPIQEQQIHQRTPDEHQALRDHEAKLAEAKEYQAAVEQENTTQNQAINMVPDRPRNTKDTPKKGGIFEAGSTISGSYN